MCIWTCLNVAIFVGLILTLQGICICISEFYSCVETVFCLGLIQINSCRYNITNTLVMVITFGYHVMCYHCIDRVHLSGHVIYQSSDDTFHGTQNVGHQRWLP